MKPVIFLFLLIFIVLSPSIYSAYNYDGLGFADFSTSQGFFNQGLTTSQIYVRTLTSAYYIPIVADLDNDGTNEIIQIDSNTIRIYQSKALTPVNSLTIPNLNALGFGIQALDIDADGKKELVTINGSTGSHVLFLSYNATEFKIKKAIVLGIVASGQSYFKCDNSTGYCLTVAAQSLTSSSGNNHFYAQAFSYTGSGTRQSLTSQAYSVQCLPVIPDIQIKDYNKDTINDFIFTMAEDGSPHVLHLFAIDINSSLDVKIKMNKNITAFYDDCTGIAGKSCASCGVSRLFSAPSVFDYATGSNLELGLAYNTDNLTFEMKLYDSSGSTIGTYPSLSNADGQIISNLVHGRFFDDDSNSFCVLGERKKTQTIDLLCGSYETSHLVTNREYSMNKDALYNISFAYGNYEMLIHSGNEDSDEFSEVISGYGVLKPDLFSGSCNVFGFCDMNLIYSNPKPNSAIISVDAEKVGRSDLIMRTSTNLWYLDDGYTYTAPYISAYYVNPCLSSTWKKNTTVETRITPISDDSFQVQAKSILYYGSTNAQESNWSVLSNSGTVFVFSHYANKTIGSGTLRLMVRDEHNLTDSLDLSFSVADNGAEFGDCYTQETISSNISINATIPNSILNPNINNNSIKNALQDIDQNFHLGIGITVIFLILMIGLGIAVWIVGAREKWNASLVGGITGFLEFLCLIIGVKLGFLSIGLVIIILVFSIGMIAFYFRNQIMS